MLEKTLESPLDCKEIISVHPKRNQPWIFIGRTDVEAPVPWPPDAKRWLTGKYPEAGKDWRQEEKRVTEDEMVRWPYWLNGYELEQTPGNSEGQGNLACYNPWGHKESDMTEQLNNNCEDWMWYHLGRYFVVCKAPSRYYYWAEGVDINVNSRVGSEKGSL